MVYHWRQIFRIGTVRYAEGLWRMRRHGPVIARCTDSEDFPHWLTITLYDYLSAVARGATPGCAGSNELARRSTALAQALVLPCLALCIALLWTLVKKWSTFFPVKKCIWVTWLQNFLTSKWPGSFTALAPPLSLCWPKMTSISQFVHINVSLTWLSSKLELCTATGRETVKHNQ